MILAWRISGQAGEAGDFDVPSITSPPGIWRVIWQADGLAWCPCPAHQLGRGCRHVREVAAVIADEKRAAAPSLEQIQAIFAR